MNITGSIEAGEASGPAGYFRLSPVMNITGPIEAVEARDLSPVMNPSVAPIGKLCHE
jgi:hypothetical protein